jgi:hypothetical protein
MANPNERWRKINQFVAFSGIGKQQSALGTPLASSDIDVRDKCAVEERDIKAREDLFNCDDVDLVDQPIRTRYKQFRFTYDKPTPQILARHGAYFLGTAAAPTGTPANEVKTLTRSGTVSGGTFTITFSLEGRTGVTEAIAYDASTSALQAALYNAAKSIGRLIKKGDVVVTGDWTTGMICTFGGRLAHADLPVFTIGNGSITGGGSVVSTETTAGANKYHAITRSTDQSKPLFSFATGEKNTVIATRIFHDAVVTDMDMTTDINGTIVQLVVTVSCNFNPDKSTTFSVPACVNPVALRVFDCRLKINAEWQSSDVVSLSAALSDQVPIEAAFAYDDLDFSVEPQRGDKPTQELTMEIYGDSDDTLYTLAEDEVTQDPVAVLVHYGNPGNRFTINAPTTKIKFQDEPTGFAGPLNQSTIKVAGTPYGTSGNPISFDCYLDQTTAFLTT